MEEQKRNLDYQIAESKERKRLEKENEERAEKLADLRLKAQIGVAADMTRFKAELSRYSHSYY